MSKFSDEETVTDCSPSYLLCLVSASYSSKCKTSLALFHKWEFKSNYALPYLSLSSISAGCSIPEAIGAGIVQGFS